MESRLKFDLHTHTVFSHGKGTIEDNVDEAVRKGLKTVGISDHGPGHKGFGIKVTDIPVMRAQIEELRGRHTAIEILLGVEANIINPSGRIDVTREQQGLFDYIIAGYHYGIFGEAPFKATRMHIGGYWYGLTGRASQRTVNYNTDIVIKALYENPIKILSHPGEKAAFDIKELAMACQETGTWMEINDHHSCLSVKGIQAAADYDVTFVMGSDAHVPANVGCCERALDRAVNVGLDLSRIVNLKQLK